MARAGPKKTQEYGVEFKRAAAQGLLTSFPDMIVSMDRIGVEGDDVAYR